MTLTPLSGAMLVVVMAVSGQAFRSAWRGRAPGWQRRAWGFALAALVSFLILAFVPLDW